VDACGGGVGGGGIQVGRGLGTSLVGDSTWTIAAAGLALPLPLALALPPLALALPVLNWEPSSSSWVSAWESDGFGT
jgi:hypothetical protein